MIYEIIFDIENTGGIAFEKTENFEIIATGRYSLRQNWSWNDWSGTKEQYTLITRHPAVVVVTSEYRQDSFNGHVGRKEKSVRIHTTELTKWVQESFKAPIHNINYDILQLVHNKIAGHDGKTYLDDLKLFPYVGWGERGTTSKGLMLHFNKEGKIEIDYWNFPRDFSYYGTITKQQAQELACNEILYLCR